MFIMRTRNILTALLMFGTFCAIGQGKNQSYISLTVGASIPTADFAKADAGSFDNWNNTAGFAKTGLAIGVEGAHYFTPRIGLAGAIYYSNHGGFSSADAAKLGDSYTDAFGVDESTVTTSGSYQALNVMIGPQYTFPLGKLALDFRVLGGLLKSISTPTMTVQLEDVTETTFTQLSSTASAFGWQVGTGIRYALTDRLGLMIRADYFASDGIKIDNENRTNSAGRLVTKQPMSWVNASAGLSFSLGK